MGNQPSKIETTKNLGGGSAESATTQRQKTDASEASIIKENYAMTMGLFPNDPAKRRAILVLKEHDIERCGYEKGAGEIILNEEVYILPYPISSQESNRILQDIAASGLDRSGNLLVQSPFNSEHYENVSEANNKFALEKYMYFSQLCMILGAKEVIVEQIKMQTQTQQASFDAQARYLVAQGKASYNSEEFQKFCSQFSLRDNFEGGEPDIEKAEAFLRQKNMFRESNMQTLLQMRQLNNNKLQTRKLSINLSSETQNRLGLVGRLNIPSFIKLSAEYQSIVKNSAEYTLTLEVKF